jgi:hypothetical protein
MGGANFAFFDLLELETNGSFSDAGIIFFKSMLHFSVQLLQYSTPILTF